MFIRQKHWRILMTGVLMALFHYVQMGIVNSYMAIGDNRPDLLMVLTVFIGYRLGSLAGAMAGFTAGLLQDVAIDFIGLNALCKTIVGFTSPYFANRRVLLVDRYYLPLVAMVLSIVHDIPLYAIQALGTTMDLFSLWTRLALPNALYNLVVMYVILMITPSRAVEAFRGPTRYS